MSCSEQRCGRVVSVNVSAEKGVVKVPVPQAELRPGIGVVGDAHSGPGERQVSLLAEESVARLRRTFQERKTRGKLQARCRKGYDELPELGPGSFAENLTIRGLLLPELPLGTRLHVGEEVVVEVSKIGKECHSGCAIFKLVGDCVMPREGIFARVLEGGVVRQGDEVVVDEGGDSDGE